LREPSVPLHRSVVLNGYGDGLFGTNEDDQLLSTGDGGIEEVALKQHIMRRMKVSVKITPPLKA